MGPQKWRASQDRSMSCVPQNYGETLSGKVVSTSAFSDVGPIHTLINIAAQMSGVGAPLRLVPGPLSR